MTVHVYRVIMPQSNRDPSHGLEARVLPRHTGLYPGLKRDVWYRVRPDGPDEEGKCWLVGYGVKQQVAIVDFEFRQVREGGNHAARA